MDENNLSSQSADDALESSREDEDLQVGQRSALPEDHSTPASPAVDNNTVPVDHQLRDTDVDSHEMYDEGAAKSTGMDQS
jgi:hypothetical protein